ncbi:MAG: putative bifunctional diguanylate cyclase/phosphodiesterase [Acidimicrobiia bacterium]
MRSSRGAGTATGVTRLAVLGVTATIVVIGVTAYGIARLVDRSSTESARAASAQATLSWANELQALEAKARAGDAVDADAIHAAATGLGDSAKRAFGTSTSPALKSLMASIDVFCDAALHSATSNPNVIGEMEPMPMEPMPMETMPMETMPMEPMDGSSATAFGESISALFTDVNGSLHLVAADARERADDAAWKARVGAAIIASLAIAGLAIGLMLFNRRRRELLIAHGLEKAESRFETLVSRAPDLLVVVGPDGDLRYVSPSVARLVGASTDDLTLDALWNALTHESQRDLEAALRRMVDGVAEAEVTLDLDDATGRRRHLDAIVSDHRTTEGVEAVVINARDVTDRIALQRQLTHEANHDPLTGLDNRRSFEAKIDEALHRTAGEADRHVALLIIDLDGFKAVNDTLGHSAGDDLLATFAARLTALRRGDETIARLGGDEFAVIMEGVAEIGEAQAAAQRMHRALWDPVAVGGELLSIAACGGLAIAGRSPNGAAPVDRDELFRRADLALYRAKRHERGKFVTYDPECESEGLEVAFVQRELSKAIEAGHIEVAYQPIVSAKTGRIESCEALARWHHRDKGPIAPDLFVSVAERSELILALGATVREQACAQLAQWQHDESIGPDLTISINVSMVELLDGRFLDDLVAMVNRHGVSPQHLVIELTEHRIDSRVGAIARALEQLRAAGFAVALDDFGAAPSSIEQLQHLHVDMIKIDRTLLTQVGRNDRNDDLLRALITFAEQLELQVVAEGIENGDQLATLAHAGCDQFQGYYLSLPLSGRNMTELLRANPDIAEHYIAQADAR